MVTFIWCICVPHMCMAHVFAGGWASVRYHACVPYASGMCVRFAFELGLRWAVFVRGVCQASWPLTFWVFPCLPLPSPCRNAGILRLICYHISVLFGSWRFELSSSRSLPYSMSYFPSSKLIIDYKISLAGDGTPGDLISSEIEIWLNPGNKENIKTEEKIKIPWVFMWTSYKSLSWNSGMLMYKRPKNIFKSQEHPRQHACTVPK